MAKKKKHKLFDEPSFDFDMIGICSHHSDYRLAWGINAHLNFHLKKLEEDYEIMNKKDEIVSSHPMYGYYDAENRIDYYLIKNLNQGMYLVPENTSMDYFLFLCNNTSIEPGEMVQELKKVKSVLAAYIYNPEELASAENLVFS